MISPKHSFRAKVFVMLAVIPLLILASCGGGGTNTGGTTQPTNNNNNISLTVGGKKDVEAQLLTTMYYLLLKHQGFNVHEKLAVGTTPIVFQALKSGAIDIYPEFTSTGLEGILKVKSVHNPQQDYQTVKTDFEQQYQITWLDPAPLNDTYGICTSKSEAQTLGVTTISQLMSKLSQLSLALPSDSTYVLDQFLTPTYGIKKTSFKSVETLDYAIGFNAVQNNQAQLNFCYTTDALIGQKNFTVLQDDKSAFPVYNPAPILKQSTLSKAPDIAKALNPLAPLLTTDISIQLQTQVATEKNGGTSFNKALTDVATNFLKSKGLL